MKQETGEFQAIYKVREDRIVEENLKAPETDVVDGVEKTPVSGDYHENTGCVNGKAGSEKKEKTSLVKRKMLWFKGWFTRVFAYPLYLSRRVARDEIDVLASSLSYTTIMSLIPVLAVLLSVFSLSPSFSSYRDEMMNYILHNMMPQMGDVLKENINSFIANASKTTAVGVGTLIIIALALIRRIDITLNKIWHVRVNRSKVTTFSVYWTVLTLGPLLLGGAIVVSSSIMASNFFGQSSAGIWLNTLGMKMLPCFLTFVVFTLLFTSVPCTKVNFNHAVVGAMLAALLQELLKQFFTHYIMNFTSYTFIYGAVAALPLMMVWTYVNWYIVLIGAEVAASISDYRQHKIQVSQETAAG